MPPSNFPGNSEVMVFQRYIPTANSERTSGPRNLVGLARVSSTTRPDLAPSFSLPEEGHLANGPRMTGSAFNVMANEADDLSGPRRYSSEFIARLFASTQAKVRFHTLQRWEGVVMEVRPESFVARLIDSRDESLVEEAEIDLEEVSPEDRDLVREGAVFYWKIEYQDRPRGRLRASNLRFQRLPNWTSEQITSARQEASRVRDLIGWE